MSGIQTKAVLKYAIMPGILPRLKGLFTSGFGYIAFLMAQIYAMVRLLPADHPYLIPQNIGHYGIRHVIAEAANALVISKKNIDQLIIFILMLTGVIILALQLVMLLAGILFGQAMATSVFVTPPGNETYDIAYMLLDQVFGVGDVAGGGPFFNSCVAQNINCDPALGGVTTGAAFPWPFHLALQNMFRFYSLGILIIATIIFLYFMLVIIVETATTGTPFGQRFKNIWAPIRLVVAVGMLIPLSHGYNSGQYIAFTAAKFGSGFATNGWIAYNTAITNSMGGGGIGGSTGNPLGERENLIAMPKPPESAVMVEFLSLLHTCAFATYLNDDTFNRQIAGTTEETARGKIRVDYPETATGNYLTNNYAVKPFLVKTPTDWQATRPAPENATFLEVTTTTTYNQALTFYSKGDIVIRFGRRGGYDMDGSGGADPISNAENTIGHGQPGHVEPTCGDIRISVTDKRDTDAASTHTGTPSDGYLGSVAVQRMYFELIRDHWLDFPSSENYIDFAGRVSLVNSNIDNTENGSGCNMGCAGGLGVNPNLPGGDCGAAYPGGSAGDTRDCAINEEISALWKQNAIAALQTTINSEMATIWQNYNTGTNEFDMDATLLNYGWGGAGIWFNKLAQVNGAFITTLMDFPSMVTYPAIMNIVSNSKKKTDSDISGIEEFNPNAAKGTTNKIDYGDYSRGGNIAIILYEVMKYWNADNKNMAKPEKATATGALETGMNLIFGTYGLFAMTDENANIHPLSQLIALGKGLVESAVRNIAGSSMAAAMGGLSKAIDTQAGPLVEAASGFLMSTAFVGLTAGFVLFYVLPFLPFVYFFFAVASWIKTIFEAMVGVPLWALAHLRIDGDGLPGESAMNGYFLIFEIFIRPILSIAGLVAALVIFTAQVRILNFCWLLVTENVGGHNSDATIAGVTGNLSFKRSIVDEFFYTVVYAIIVYMLATTSFKLIDKVPDNILRWMGGSVSSFGDINQDATESLTRYAAMGGMTAGRQAAGGIKDLSGGMGGAFGSEIGKMGSDPRISSDRRLKENIEHLGYENGLPIYSFSYIGEKEIYKGVMAQDLLNIKPEAVVIEDNGYMAVRYDLIGIKMELIKESAGNDNV